MHNTMELLSNLSVLNKSTSRGVLNYENLFCIPSNNTNYVLYFL
jgi:hypothetical protein